MLGLACQPMTLEETTQGAKNRAVAAAAAIRSSKDANESADTNHHLSMGIESGLFEAHGKMFDVCCCAIYDGSEHHIGCAVNCFLLSTACLSPSTAHFRNPLVQNTCVRLRISARHSAVSDTRLRGSSLRAYASRLFTGAWTSRRPSSTSPPTRTSVTKVEP